jgi:cold shock CspA family protein
MTSKPRITLRHVEQSEEIEQQILTETAKLDALYGQLMGCHVTVELPHRHHKKGNRYQIHIALAVPQGEIVVKREPSLSASARQMREIEIQKHAETQVPHKDLRIAIHDAFKAARRRLQDYARRQRGSVKSHEPLPEARVSKVFPRQGYGFLTTGDGREIYFHENSVLGEGFRRLKIGSVVKFVERMGEKGPQASTVRLRQKPRMRAAG